MRSITVLAVLIGALAGSRGASFIPASHVMEISALPITSRTHPATRQRQLLTSDILVWLQTRLPNDAYCVLAITMADLYPADDWNFVFVRSLP